MCVCVCACVCVYVYGSLYVCVCLSVCVCGWTCVSLGCVVLACLVLCCDVLNGVLCGWECDECNFLELISRLETDLFNVCVFEYMCICVYVCMLG